MGLGFIMPTVLEQEGFQIKVFLPPREHGPAHVHVYKAGGVAVINLPDATQALTLRSVSKKMRNADVVAAVRLVEANVETCQTDWRKYHA